MIHQQKIEEALCFVERAHRELSAEILRLEDLRWQLQVRSFYLRLIHEQLQQNPQQQEAEDATQMPEM